MIEGNGAGVIRLAARVQRALERLYRIDPIHDVEDFIAISNDARETLLVAEDAEGLRLELRLPTTSGLDGICQVIEGVSHFVYVAERARCDHRITQLELEIQAEVDKWVVLADSIGIEGLCERLYEDVRYTNSDERYRVANASAHRFVRGLERKLDRVDDLRGALRRFFWSTQEEKLRLAA